MVMSLVTINYGSPRKLTSPMAGPGRSIKNLIALQDHDEVYPQHQWDESRIKTTLP